MAVSDSTPEELAPNEEVEALLRSLARPDGLPAHLLRSLEAQAPMVAGLLQSSAERAIVEPCIGDVLDGRYRLDRLLGRGGMGVVFAAHDLKAERAVAVKWMSAQRSFEPERAAALAQRFRREARAAARIRHPNVVEVHDVGGSESAPYLVMELLEGESLRQTLGAGALSWNEALAIILPVMHGAAAAHAAGIVHRDLKPDNIFLCGAPGAERAPKVLDFGIAAIHEASGTDLSTLTRTGAVLGTPSYMPLEQLKGESVDARADVYALGVVLYEVLSKQLPFQARGASELAVKQATELPVPLSRHVPALRGEREAAVMKALARHPADRYPDLASFAAALARAGARRTRSTLIWITVALAVCAIALAWQRNAQRDAMARRPAAAAAHAAPQPMIETPKRLAPAEIERQKLAQPRPAPAAEPQTPPVASPPRARRAKPTAPPVVPTEPERREPTEISFDDF